MVKAFRIFIGKRMINDYLIESQFGKEYVYIIVKNYRMGS